MASHLRQRLHLPSLGLSCSLAQLGWPTIVPQQHPLQAHRLSTARTDHHLWAVVTGGWRWHHLIDAMLEELQLAAQAGEAAAHPQAEQAVVAHFHEAFG